MRVLYVFVTVISISLQVLGTARLAQADETYAGFPTIYQQKEANKGYTEVECNNAIIAKLSELNNRGLHVWEMGCQPLDGAPKLYKAYFKVLPGPRN